MSLRRNLLLNLPRSGLPLTASAYRCRLSGYSDACVSFDAMLQELVFQNNGRYTVGMK